MTVKVHPIIYFALTPDGMLLGLRIGLLVNRRDLLCAVGRALYGPQFQTELARRLGVNKRTMRRWVAGESVPETEVFDDLLALVDDQVVVLTELRDALVTRQGQERGAP